jgi:hypothetical protein
MAQTIGHPALPVTLYNPAIPKLRLRLPHECQGIFTHALQKAPRDMLKERNSARLRSGGRDGIVLS